MRVIAGKAKSLKLKTPEGPGTRPTTDRIKETLFNMIQDQIPGCLFIDLFAGSGGIGIEALSRGARHVYFVDSGREAAACIQENLSFTKLSGDATLQKQDVFTALAGICEKEADIVFMDPPYRAGYEEKVFEILSHMPYVTENTLLIWETEIGKETGFLRKLGYEVIREKRYRTNKHVFAMRSKEFE